MPKQPDTRFSPYHHELIARMQPRCLSDGFNATAIQGLSFICATQPSAPIQATYAPACCVIVQGAKKVTAGQHILRYGPGDFLVSSVDMHVVGQVTEASPAHPYLCLYLQLDMTQLGALVGDMPARAGEPSEMGMFVSKMNEPLLESLTRLTRLLETPEDIPVLAELMKREIFYRLLQSPRGHSIRQLVMAGSQLQRISKAIHLIKAHFDKPLRVEELAQSVNMSTSSLHAHFKQVTQLSPMQYQKRLRLQEARRLMLMEVTDAANAAFQVGYESPSHFSREYARLFGAPPIKDITRLREETAA